MNKGATICLVVTILIMLFILFMVFCPPKAPAGEIHGNVEFGQATETQDCFTILNIAYDFDLWVFKNSIYGGIECWFTPYDFKGYPFLDIYKIGYTISYGIFYIDLYHWCSHAVYSDQTWDEWKENLKLSHAMSTVAIGVRF